MVAGDASAVPLKDLKLGRMAHPFAHQKELGKEYHEG